MPDTGPRVLSVPSDVQRHERRQLGRTRIDPTAGTGVLRRHPVVRKRSYRDRERRSAIELIRFGLTRVSTGPATSVRLRGCAASPAAASRETAASTGRRLADGEDVGVRPEVPHRLDDVVDVLVEPETTGRDRDVPGVVPIDDKHVVVGQQRADRGPQQRREVPRDGPTSNTCGWSVTSGLAKCSTLANGVEMAGRTSTSVTRRRPSPSRCPSRAGHGWDGQRP